RDHRIRWRRLRIRGWAFKDGGTRPHCSTITAFTAYSADMNRAPAPVPSIEETSLNRLWAAPKLPRLSFNQLAVSGCTVAVPPDQLGRWRAGRQLRHTRRGSSMMVAIRQT